jgi:hypothetical protein
LRIRFQSPAFTIGPSIGCGAEARPAPWTIRDRTGTDVSRLRASREPKMADGMHSGNGPGVYGEYIPRRRRRRRGARSPLSSSSSPTTPRAS